MTIILLHVGGWSLHTSTCTIIDSHRTAKCHFYSFALSEWLLASQLVSLRGLTSHRRQSMQVNIHVGQFNYKSNLH